MFEGMGAGTPFGDDLLCMVELPLFLPMLLFQEVPTYVHQREAMRGKSA